MEDRGVAQFVARVAHNDEATGSSPVPATKRYQKIGHAEIHTLRMEGNAFDVARENYAKYSGLDFAEDLLNYLRTGYVVSRPNLFAMAKPIEREGRRGWFIQIAVGNILELLTCLPCPLDFIAFCRNNDDNMRVVEWDWFMKKVAATKEA